MQNVKLIMIYLTNAFNCFLCKAAIWTSSLLKTTFTLKYNIYFLLSSLSIG